MRPLSTEADLRSAGERPRRLISWLVLAGTAAIPSTALAYRTELDTSAPTRGLALLLGLALGTCVWALAELVSTASPREQRVGAALPGGGLPGGGLPNGGLRVAVARMAGARVLVAAAIVSVLAMAARSVQVAVAMSLGALIGAALAAPSLTESRSALVPHPNRADGTQPLLRSRPALAVGPLLLTFGASIALSSGHSWLGWGALLLAVALALAPRCSANFAAWGEHAIRSVQQVVGSILAALSFSLLGLLILPVSWLRHVASRKRFEPRSPPGNWQPRRAVEVRGRGRGSRRLALAFMAVLLTIGAGYFALRRSFTPDGAIFDAPAMASSPWWPELSRAQAVTASVTRTEAWGVEVLPFSLESPHLNIKEHRRVTWDEPAARPGTPDCPPLRVWAFGGSTMFGYGQRDEFTVASQLAKGLHDHGVSARVENFGVPGDTLWIETRKLESELLADTTKPDLVVFYDGVNEYGAQELLGGLGRAGTPPLAAFEDSGMFDGFARAQGWINRWVTPNDGIATQMYGPEVGTVDAIAATATQYERSLDSARRLLGSYDIAGLWFLQPVRATRDRPVADEENEAEHLSEDRSRAAFRAMAVAGGEEVVDLREAMDRERTPVYYDGIHTNERGAELVAEAMLPTVEAQLGELQSERGVECGRSADG